MLKFVVFWTLLGCFSFVVKAQDLSSRVPRKSAQRPTKISPKTKSKDQKLIDSWILNFGTHTEFYNNVQVSTSGEARKIDWKAPTIGFGAAIPISGKWSFLPELNWVLPRTQSKKVMKNLLMYRADFGYDALDWLRLRIGTSIMHANQHGQGGKANLNNGAGTSTFYYPDENRSSLNNTLDLGVEARYDEWAFRLQTYIYSVFIEEKRQVSYTLFVSYYWDR